MMDVETLSEMSDIYSTFTWLMTQEDFIVYCHSKSFKSHTAVNVPSSVTEEVCVDNSMKMAHSQEINELSCSSLLFCKLLASGLLCLLSVSCWFLAWHILQSWRWRRHVSSKRLSTFNRLHGIISQRIILHYHRCENLKSSTLKYV
jgi:hypothetical protein